MTLLEFIGFIVSMLALVVLMIKKVLNERNRRANPELYEREEQEQAERLRAFLNAVHDDMQSDTPSPQPGERVRATPSYSPPREQPNQQKPSKRTVRDEFTFTSSIADRKLSSTVEKRKLKSSLDEKYHGLGSDRIVNTDITSSPVRDAYQLKPARSFASNRALKTISHLKSRRDLIVIHEILDKPKGLKDPMSPKAFGD